MIDSKQNEPTGCGWFILFAMITIALTGISLSIDRVATALDRIAQSAEHTR